MNRNQALNVYDSEYAATYDARFHAGKPASDHELRILRDLLAQRGGPWLDVACGTGYVLGRFSGVPRAGLDISPAMLARARAANPDALFFREGDFLEDVPEWHGEWALVTCMWYSYGLVDSIADVERLVMNLARWTSASGSCFVPLCDPAKLVRRICVPYCSPDPFSGGHIMITGVTWSWKEAEGKEHQNMVAPQVERMVEMFEHRFASIELIEYPLGRSRRSPKRKAIVATAKKGG